MDNRAPSYRTIPAPYVVPLGDERVRVIASLTLFLRQVGARFSRSTPSRRPIVVLQKPSLAGVHNALISGGRNRLQVLAFQGLMKRSRLTPLVLSSDC